jgi:hypothetical protein
MLDLGYKITGTAGRDALTDFGGAGMAPGDLVAP